MFKLTLTWTVAAVVLTANPSVARADVWDVNTQNDNLPTSTENELMHGSDQLHDLGGTNDLDHYVIGQRPRSSWEVVVDSTSGDLNTPSAAISLQRVTTTATVLQTAQPVTTSLNFNQSLRWQNTSSDTISNEVIKVSSSACATAACGADDVYRIRAFETTYAIPRFNNTSGQATVIVVQNTAPYVIAGTMFVWTDAGSFITAHTFSVQPKALFLATSANVPAMANASGSITITHDGRYGDLAGKGVSLEPENGFTFDTPMTHRAK